MNLPTQKLLNHAKLIQKISATKKKLVFQFFTKSPCSCTKLFDMVLNSWLVKAAVQWRYMTQIITNPWNGCRLFRKGLTKLGEKAGSKAQLKFGLRIKPA